MIEEHVLTHKLLLSASGLQVSQALPMGTNNQLQVQIRVESGAGSALTTPGLARVQTSPDMENWTDSSSLYINLTDAPMTGTTETYSSSQVSAPWIRIQYTGGSLPLLVTAIIRLFHS